MSEFFLTLPKGLLDDLKPEILAVATQAPDSFMNLGKVVATTAYDARDTYTEYLEGHAIPGFGALKRPALLKGSTICRPLNAMAWSIGHEDENAKWIEEGQPERDMKKSLATAPKARMSKSGAKYLIIPFRIGTPDARGFSGAMTPAVYRQAKAMAFSYHLGQNGTRVSATGHTVPLFTYKWGDRLKAGAGPKTKPWHVTDPFAGMYRFHDSGTTKQSKSSGYITFRVMSEKSDPRSWIRPAQPGMHPLDTAMQEAWNANSSDLNAALWEDIQVMWSGV